MNFYANIEDANTFADSNGFETWVTLTEDEKTLILYYATVDIEKTHKQPRDQFNIPWMFGDVWLREAALNQAMFVLKTKGTREFLEKAKMLTRSSFNDSIISLGAIGGDEIDKTAKRLTRQVMAQMGATAMAEFGRG